MVRHRLVENHGAGPLVGGKDEMAQRSTKDHSSSTRRPGQLRAAARHGRRSRPRDARSFPHRTESSAVRIALSCTRSGCRLSSSPSTNAVTSTSLTTRLLTRPDTRLNEPRVSDLGLAQVTVPEVRAGEVSAREAGTAKFAGPVVVSRHRGSLPPPGPGAATAAALRPASVPAKGEGIKSGNFRI